MKKYVIDSGKNVKNEKIDKEKTQILENLSKVGLTEMSEALSNLRNFINVNSDKKTS